MKKIYLLKGLNCPNCAAKIESETASLDGVLSATVNLMNETITVEVSAESEGSLLIKLTEIVHSHEADVGVFEYSERKTEDEDEDISGSVRKLVIGAIVFILGIILSVTVKSIPTISTVTLVAAYLILGYDVIKKALGNIVKGRVFDENFLMTLSTVGAFCIGEYHEAVAVMLFYQIGELFQDYSVRRSRKSITELMDIRPEFANVLRDGKLYSIIPESVMIGETVVIKPGEKIPLDGTVTEGSAALDMTALTGESLPREVAVGDSVLSGSINKNGVISVKVTKLYEDSTVANILELVENASSKKAPTENFITVFARYYTPAVVIASLLLGIIPPLFFNAPWSEWLHRAMVFLVVSCPCALVISVPLAFFGGIGTASRHGILVKGANYLEALDKVDTVVFDKTGTLTKGNFAVSSIFSANDTDKEKLLELAAFAEFYSNHPIAKSIVSAYGKEIDGRRITDYEEIPGRGVTAKADGIKIAAGNSSLLADTGIEIDAENTNGTVVYVAADGEYLGYIVISDEIKADSISAVNELRRAGVRRTVMLTGDSDSIASAVAEELGIDEYHASLLPADKVSILEKIKAGSRGKTVFVGDGINDAPVITSSDVGVAMGALGSDAAIEAADVVLMTDEVSKVAKAIKIAHRTKQIVIENIVFSLVIKIFFLILGAFGIAGMWEAVFGDVGVALLAVFNSMRILKYKC